MERGYWIRSKPVYTALQWRQRGCRHIVVASGEGGRAVLKLYQQKLPSAPVEVLYSPEAGCDLTSSLRSALGDDLTPFADSAQLAAYFDHLLSTATMGTQLYAAGTEQCLWQAADIAARHGVLNDDVMKELSGSLARPVYCVHCKATTPDATTNIVACIGCGRQLFVRDHFSRRLKAYMGFMIDAEAPGEVPAVEEIYP